MPKEKRLTKTQLKEWRIASNRVSVEAIRYAADIVGYTDVTRATITALEAIINDLTRHGSTEGRASVAECQKLLQKASKATLRDEPLVHPLRIALKWAASDGKGEFLVGNIVDPIYATKIK